MSRFGKLLVSGLAVVICIVAAQPALGAPAASESPAIASRTTSIVFDPPSRFDAPSDMREFIEGDVPPAVRVTCSDEWSEYSSYAWPAWVNMESSAYRSYLIVPDWIVDPECTYASTRRSIQIEAEGRRWDGNVWTWGYEFNSLQEFMSFAAVESTWTPPFEINHTEQALAPGLGWWVGLSSIANGQTDLIEGEIVELAPSFVNDSGIDVCPFGQGACNWDFKVRVPFGSDIGGNAVFASNGSFLGQVLEGVEWDLEDPGPANTYDVWVTGTPAACLAVFACADTAEGIWVRRGVVTAPVITSVVPMGGATQVSWTPSTVDGKSLPKGRKYLVKAYPGEAECLVPATKLTCVVQGLSPGNLYSFVVYVIGDWSSNHSTPSDPVQVEAPKPSKLTKLKATTRGKFTTIRWARPPDWAGISRYEWRVGATPSDMGEWNRLEDPATLSLRLKNYSRGSRWIVQIRGVWGDQPGPIAVVRYKY